MVTGIDCSKDYFDIAVLKDDKIVFSGRFDNNMEATGPYYFQLAKFIVQQGIKVSVLNPLAVRRFAQMRMERAKTDKKDAVLIAQFTAMTKPKEWVLPSEQILQIRNLETYLSGIKERRQILYNQWHSLTHLGTMTKELEQEIMDEIEAYDLKINLKQKQIANLIDSNYGQLAKNLLSIPGIGPRSTALLITLTERFQGFDGYRQIISYFGLAPRIYQSGNSVRGRNKICKMGMAQIRKVLYMAATSAIRCNRACKELYDRLRAKGKPYKVAMIAVINKLIKQIFAIAKSGKPYKVQLL